jgi:flavin-dependent dehydrogenase
MPPSRPACWPPRPPTTPWWPGASTTSWHAYPAAFEQQLAPHRTQQGRNFKAWFKKGLTTATLMNGVEQFVLRGHIPWTLHRDKPDHAYLKPAAECKPIVYPKPDGKLTFDRCRRCSSPTPTTKKTSPPT